MPQWPRACGRNFWASNPSGTLYGVWSSTGSREYHPMKPTAAVSQMQVPSATIVQHWINILEELIFRSLCVPTLHPCHGLQAQSIFKVLHLMEKDVCHFVSEPISFWWCCLCESYQSIFSCCSIHPHTYAMQQQFTSLSADVSKMNSLDNFKTFLDGMGTQRHICLSICVLDSECVRLHSSKYFLSHYATACSKLLPLRSFVRQAPFLRCPFVAWLFLAGGLVLTPICARWHGQYIYTFPPKPSNKRVCPLKQTWKKPCLCW